MAEKIRTRKELEDKIKEILEIDSISLLISKQITKYTTEYRWSFLDIGRALFYFFNIKDGDKSKSLGIGIVPYVIDESRSYFQDLERQIAEQKEAISKAQEMDRLTIICNKTQRKKNRKRTIDLTQFREEEDDE